MFSNECGPLIPLIKGIKYLSSQKKNLHLICHALYDILDNYKKFHYKHLCLENGFGILHEWAIPGGIPP